MCVPTTGRIVAIVDEGDPVARGGVVLTGERRLRVGLSCVPEARVGDTVMIHAGFAIRVVTTTAVGSSRPTGSPVAG